MAQPTSSPSSSATSARERLIVALDTPDAATALSWAESLRGEAGLFKVGLELFVAEGPAVVRRLHEQGHGLFLDLKFHDIPNTCAGAIRSAARMGVRMMNVHASGGPAMLRAAAEAAREFGAQKPILLGVTVLTSLDAAALARIGVTGTPAERVQAWARMCQEEGLDGVVASAQEAALIRAACGPEFVIVTPGIRPAGSAVGDQKRIATPAGAMRDGAHYLVVGRAITAAGDPAGAARGVVEEMAGALAELRGSGSA